MNQVNIIGRLTKDAELKATSTGFQILRGTIAVNNLVKKDGKYEQEGSFIDFTWLGERAAKLAQYMTKGAQLGIVASLKQERWQDKDGGNRSKIVLMVKDVTLLGGKKSENPSEIIKQEFGEFSGFDDEALPY